MATNTKNQAKNLSQSAIAVGQSIINNRMLTIGVVLLFVSIVPVVFTPQFTTFAPGQTNYQSALQPPSTEHLMGTDNFGRDVFVRVLYGARISLLISVIGTSIAFLIGVSFGMAAGYFGGRLDELLMRVIDIVMVFPAFVLALILIPAIGGGIISIIIAIGLVYSPNFARISRGSTLTVKQEAFVEASKCVGFSDFKIIRSDIFPNIIGPLLVQATITSGYAIIVESGLSFLGIGVSNDQASLGLILAAGRQFLQSAPWIIMGTGIYMTILILSFNLVGDGIRDALDPKLEQEINEGEQ